MPTEKKDARPAPSGISAELLKEIDAQYAIIDSARKLINQQALKSKNEQISNNEIGARVYNMKDLAYWIHHYTKRRRLHCPKCKTDSTFKCETCEEVYEYHDEL